MTKVIAIAGKKGAGKNTVATFLAGLTLTSFRVIPEFRVQNNHLLIEEKEYHPNVFNTKIVKVYAFADSLKEMAVEVLGLKPQQVYGTEFQKNTKTHLRWENMPGVITNEKQWEELQKWHEDRLNAVGKKEAGKLPLIFHEGGYMTGRQVMQFMGTEIFRKVYKKCWNVALYNRIKKDNPVYALISDLRFDNELKFISEELDATSIYLTRDVNGDDSHESENGLSSLTPFSVIVNNDSGDLRELFKETVEKLQPLKVLAPIS